MRGLEQDRPRKFLIDALGKPRSSPLDAGPELIPIELPFEKLVEIARTRKVFLSDGVHGVTRTLNIFVRDDPDLNFPIFRFFENGRESCWVMDIHLEGFKHVFMPENED